MLAWGPTYHNNFEYLGKFSRKAADEATKYGKVNLVIPPTSLPITTLPHPDTWNLSSNASFVYYCDNETVSGTYLFL